MNDAMTSSNHCLDAVKALLFEPATGANVFGIVDGAAVPELPRWLTDYEGASICLLRGELDDALARAAPYLVQLEFGSPLLDWLLGLPWGQHWGVFLISQAGFRDLRQHCRVLLTVYDETGRPLYFRYYDPRVLRVYLPTCDQAQAAAFFGPVDRCVMAAETENTWLDYRLKAGKLVCQTCLAHAI